jgi:hypothetical protein
MPTPRPQSASALAAAAIIQLQTIGMLLTPDRPTEAVASAKTKAARTLVDGMIGDMKRIVDCDSSAAVIDADNVLQFSPKQNQHGEING